MDFIEIAKIIFENRNRYENVSDSDKINAFYMINKKLSLVSIKDKNGKKKELYKICELLNNKHIDRDSALDLFYLFFKNINQNGTPGDWWIKNTNKKEKAGKSIPKSDKELIMSYENLSESEYDFLIEHYRDDVEYKIKLLKRLE